MAYGLIDDKIHCHRKFARAKLEATGLWLLCHSWVCDNLTDGFIPTEIVQRYAGSEARARKLSSRLVRCGDPGSDGLWKECEGGFQMHDYLAHNESRDAIVSRRESERDRKQSWRKKANENRKTNRMSQRDTSGTRHGTPGDPTPTPTPSGEREIASSSKPPADASLAGPQQQVIPLPEHTASDAHAQPAPKRARKPRRGPERPGWNELLAAYSDAWKASRSIDGRGPAIDGADISALTRVYDTAGFAETKALIQRFVSDDDGFVMRRGHLLRDLPARLNAYHARPSVRVGPAPVQKFTQTGDVTHLLREHIARQRA